MIDLLLQRVEEREAFLSIRQHKTTRRDMGVAIKLPLQIGGWSVVGLPISSLANENWVGVHSEVPFPLLVS